MDVASITVAYVLYRVSQKKGYRNVIVTHPIHVLNMGKF